VAWLEALETPDWERAYRHPRIGPVSTGDLITAWVAHDLITWGN